MNRRLICGLTPHRRRHVDDRELDSGDDEGRTDRVPEADEEDQPEMLAQERLIIDLEIPRQPLPEPSDGEVLSLFPTRVQGWSRILTSNRRTS